MAESKALVQAKGSIKKYFQSEQVQKGITAVAAKHMDSHRLMKVALNVILTNPKLAECTPASLLRCVVLSAQLGLEPDPVLQLCAYIPYGKEAQFVPMYRGKLDLAYRSGLVKSAIANPVYEKDDFDYSYGMPGHLHHKPYMGDEDPGPVIASYCIFEMKDGSFAWHVCPKYEIERHRAKSQNPRGKDRRGNYVAWDERGSYPEMAMKTAIHVTSKFVRLSTDYELAQSLDERADMGRSQAGLVTAMEDVFGIPDEPIEIEAEPEQEESEPEEGEKKAAPAKESMDWEGLYATNKGLQKFVEITAKHHKLSIEEVHAKAVENFEGFWSGFQNWMENQKKKKKVLDQEPQQEEPPPPEPPREKSISQARTAWMEKYKVTNERAFAAYLEALCGWLNEVATRDNRPTMSIYELQEYVMFQVDGKKLYVSYVDWFKAEKAKADAKKPKMREQEPPPEQEPEPQEEAPAEPEEIDVSLQDLKEQIQQIHSDWFPNYTWDDVDEWIYAEMNCDFQGLNANQAQSIIRLLSVPDRDECSLVLFHQAAEEGV